MGYFTAFSGAIAVSPPMGEQLRDRINKDEPYQSEFAPFLVSDDGATIRPYDDREKWYDAAEKLHALHLLLVHYGYLLDGHLTWEGEEHSDFGKIHVTTLGITVQWGMRTYGDPKPLTGREGNFCANG